MKTIVTTIRFAFAILFVSTFFIACETTSIQDEQGIEDQEIRLGEDDAEEIEKPA